MKIKILILFNLFAVSLRANDVNIAKYRIVNQSSSADANHCGHLVTDGSLDTYWESQPGDSQWLTINLKSLHKIKKVTIYWGENYATDYTISCSSNINSSESIIYKGQNESELIKTIDCNNITAAIVRIDIYNVRDRIRGCNIKEIQVTGDDDGRFIPSCPVHLSGLSLDGNIWRIQNASFINDNPGDISKPGFNDKEWIPARVPGTILGSYCDFGAFPDPYFGDNMYNISDAFFSSNDFWYRTSVILPAGFNSKRLFLDLGSINWKAEIYINGQYLGRMDGAFIRGEFDVTKYINPDGENTIAVLVKHLDNWVSGNHKIIRKYLGARTTNGDMLGFDSPACLAAAGWNWIPIIKGRNDGIWNHVTFRAGGKVSITDPWVTSVLHLPDTARADLTINTDLKNESNEIVNGTLKVIIGSAAIELPVKLNAGETRSVKLDKDLFIQLSLKNPKLWWPNGYGAQNLTRVDLQFKENNNVLDTKTVYAGIRQLDYKIVNNILFIYCNGARILIRGGNWGLPEAMLNCDSAGYDLRVKLHKDANLNMIRNWVGLTYDKEFYNSCDRYGILVWDDFWLANPVDGPDPKDTLMFMNNVRDKIKLVRQHPSLAFYCGRNEGLPPLGLDIGMKKATEQLDGTRLYIPHSASGIVSGNGPYFIQDLDWYFTNRGKTLHSELGIISFPESESLHRMLPSDKLWPINDMWAIHDYQWGRSEKYTARIASRFGEPAGVDDYCHRAQLLNYESAKAMFESLQSNQGSGILLWMSQAAWPSMICQLYDHYFEYTAGYFSVRKACEPVHIFWDISANEVKVANNTIKKYNNLTAKVLIYNIQGKIEWEKSLPVNIMPASAITCFSPQLLKDGKTKFIKLILKDKDKVVSDNFYWTEDSVHQCLALNALPKTDIKVKVIKSQQNGMYHVIVNMLNSSSNVALMVKLKVKNGKTGDSILPVFYSDNYISLLPYESKEISLDFKSELAGNDNPQLWVEGYNNESIKTEL